MSCWIISLEAANKKIDCDGRIMRSEASEEIPRVESESRSSGNCDIWY